MIRLPVLKEASQVFFLFYMKHNTLLVESVLTRLSNGKQLFAKLP